jgi:hypothetical protein
MNLKTLKKEISNTVYKQAEAFIKFNNVRELEETKPSEFIAFVDDGPESFDVSVQLDEKFNIVSSSCDCPIDEGFCAHKTAVALFLKERGTSSSSSVAKKIKTRKVDALRALINDIHIDHLRDWVYDLSKTNKEFQIILKNKFDRKVISLSWEDIEATHKEKQKAILKNAKYYDASQLIKILGLLQEYHQNLIEEVTLREKIDLSLLDRLLKYLYDFQHSARKKGERLGKYIETLKENIELKLSMMPQEKYLMALEDWISHFTKSKVEDSYLWPVFIKDYFKLFDKKEINHLGKLIQFANKEELNLVRNVMVELSDDSGILKDIITQFKPSKWTSDYSFILIEKYIQYEFYNEAERIILNYLANSSGYNDYKLRQYLIIIYKANNQMSRVLDQLKLTVVSDFDYDNYNKVCDYLDPEELSRFKQKFKRAIDNARGSNSYALFYLKKYSIEKNWKDMMELVKSPYSFLILEPYLLDLMSYDRDKLLLKLLYMWGESYYMSASDKAAIIDFITNNYSRDQVIKVLKSRGVYYYQVSSFVQNHFDITRSDLEN